MFTIGFLCVLCVFAVRFRSRKHQITLKPQDLFAEVEIGKQRARRSFVRHVPAVEDVGAVCERQHQVQMVLDDQNRDFLPELLDRLEDFIDHGWDRPSNGSSISSSLTLPERARAIATICCSPPESRSALT